MKPHSTDLAFSAVVGNGRLLRGFLQQGAMLHPQRLGGVGFAFFGLGFATGGSHHVNICLKEIKQCPPCTNN